MNKVLTIAGSDCSGGAGIQADLKTIMYHSCYGMSVITALTSQNTLGVTGVLDINSEFIEKQMTAVFEDIVPDSVKIGMVSQEETIKTITYLLKKYQAKNIVVDPVMVSTSGSKLISDKALTALKNELIPLATIITPNIYEAEILSNISIKTKRDMERAASIIREFYQGTIVIKGGHLDNQASDLVYIDSTAHWLISTRIDNENTHGTGCTLSSAIASNLALGFPLLQSVENAKKYVTKAINSKLNLGSGRGPLNHQCN